MRLGGGRMGEGRCRRLSLAREMHRALGASDLRRIILSQFITKSYTEHSGVAVVATIHTDTYFGKLGDKGHIMSQHYYGKTISSIH